MKNGKMVVGLDSGHIDTKAVMLRGEEILGRSKAPTGFDVGGAAETVLRNLLADLGASLADLSAIITTGIFRDVVKAAQVDVTASIPEYVANAKGGLFLNKRSRTIIDIGGNIHQAISYDQTGNVLDVIQNDKCADGLGIFYTSIGKAMGLDEGELSRLALESTKDVSVAIQCALSAQSEAIDLLCQGAAVADVSKAIKKFIDERVAAMSTSISLAPKIVIAGGLAKSPALVEHLSSLLEQEIAVLDFPEYVGALGAAISYEGGR